VGVLEVVGNMAQTWLLRHADRNGVRRGFPSFLSSQTLLSFLPSPLYIRASKLKTKEGN